jgi:hypothetical protein
MEPPVDENDAADIAEDTVDNVEEAWHFAREDARNDPRQDGPFKTDDWDKQ